MIAELIIVVLTAVSCGLFAWLFLLRMSSRLLEYKNSLAATTESRFAEMFVFIDVGRWINHYLALVLFLPLVVWILSREVWLGLVILLLVLAAPFVGITLLHRRRLRRIEGQLPDAIAMLAASLRAGASITGALDSLIQESAPPLSQEFSLLLREIRLGVDMDTAFDHMEQRIALEEFRLLLAAIRISREVGGNLSETLEKLAATLRAKLAMAGKIRSLTAQGRLQGIVMSLLPMLLIVVLLQLEPETMGMLFTTKLGLGVFALILCMQIMGFMIIRKITTIDI